MKILSATVFLSLGMAIGTAISAVSGAGAGQEGPGLGETRSVEVTPRAADEADHVPAIESISIEAGSH